jgi:hypothetical protein
MRCRQHVPLSNNRTATQALLIAGANVKKHLQIKYTSAMLFSLFAYQRSVS